MKTWNTNFSDLTDLWPKTPTVEMEPPHSDARGSIQCLVNLPSKNVSLINSKKGSLRSNHYHKTDWHYMFVVTGLFDYYFRPVGSKEPPAKIRYRKGDFVFTPPMEEHATVFCEETDLIVISRNPRDQVAYEEDVVRVELVNPKTVHFE
jgi:hypothetical protein